MGACVSQLAFQTTLDAFQQAATPRALSSVFEQHAARRGARGYVGTSHRANDRADIFLITSLPDVFGSLDETGPWWDDDPLLDRVDTGLLTPFGFEEEMPKASAYAAMRFDVMREAGLGRGRVLPTSGGGCYGGVLLFADTAVDAAAELAAHDKELQALSVLLQGFLTAFSLGREPDGEVVVRLGSDAVSGRGAVGRRQSGEARGTTDTALRLTPREQDCLTWVALGKSAEEIAVILGLSVHTVRFHLRRAMARLETRTQAQAVAVALRAGLIAP